MNTNLSRRWFVKSLAAVAVMVSFPGTVFSRATGAFNAGKTDNVVDVLFGDLPIEENAEITFRLPDIAENGAVVPVTVATEIEGVTQIAIVIDENPNPLSAVFDIGEMSLADVSTRIKIGKSSVARAYVKTSDKVFMTSKEVKVTIGGCGG
jgi:sulfur-oxidizing protein SoxY